MALRWVIAGGGTGGHVTLALALGEVIDERGDDLLFIGSDAGQEAKRVPDAGFALVTLASRQVVGRSLIGRALGAASILRASLQASTELRRFDARIVVSVGGYASLPTAFAAIVRRIPLVLVEPNAMPGRANRLTARFAKRVFTGFEDAAKVFVERNSSGEKGPRASANTGAARIRCTGIPLRRELVARFSASAPRDIPQPPFRVLIFGGSQGARQINEALIEAAPELARCQVEIFHQTGEADRQRVAQAYADAHVDARVVAFEEDMPARYRWAHVAISRAGALSIAELTLAGLPALLVPYPFAADDHQAANAAGLEAAGGAVRLEALADHRLPGSVVMTALSELFAAPERLASMSAAALKLARPNAAQEIILDCAQLVGEPQPSSAA